MLLSNLEICLLHWFNSLYEKFYEQLLNAFIVQKKKSDTENSNTDISISQVPQLLYPSFPFPRNSANKPDKTLKEVRGGGRRWSGLGERLGGQSFSHSQGGKVDIV